MKFDASNNGLIGNGQLATQCAASAVVKTGAGRVCRILVVSGTGTIDVYDGTSGAGTHLWSGTAAAGGIFVLDCPTVNGIYVALGATTTVTVVYT